MTVEHWRPIPGFEGSYSVSDQGQVRSENRRIVDRNGRAMRYHGQILAVGVRNADGRRTVSLGRNRTRMVYHLVLEAFIGPCPKGMEARHLDDDTSNDRLSNLAWGTSSQNKQDIIRNTGRDHCTNGHRYTAETTYWYNNSRHCRICRATPSARLCKLCEEPVLARGWCSKHYTRWYRHSDPMFANISPHLL